MSKLSENITIIINKLDATFGTEVLVEHWLPDINANDSFSRLAKKAASTNKKCIFISPMTWDNSQASNVLSGDSNKPIPTDINDISLILFVKKSNYETNGLDLYDFEENVKNCLVNLELSHNSSRLLCDGGLRSNTAYGNNFIMNSIIKYKFGHILDGVVVL